MGHEKRDIFRLLLELAKLQPWVADKEKELESLINNDCADQKQQELLVDLISRFEYLPQEKYRSSLESLVNMIITDKELSDADTQIVAMAADSGSDSSQYLLYDLKRIFAEKKWREYKQVNIYSHAYRTYNKSNSHKNIVLIDECVGSGQTVINRIKSIKSVFADNNIVDYTIRARVLVSTEQGLQAIKEEGIDVEALVVIKKGITDYYKDAAVIDENIDLMLQLEAILSTTYKDREMPSLGYGKSESLYVREHGNTPNCVFPIFWWPFYKSEEERDTILIRAMGDA